MGLRSAGQGIQYMFGVQAFLPPNLHQIVPQDPGQTEYIWSPICLLQNAHITKLYFSDGMFKKYSRVGQVFGLIISRCPGSFWSGPEFLFCSKTFLHSPKEGSSGSSRQQNSWNVELINFLPSSNSRPRYLIYEYRWRVSAGICQNTHLTLRR